MTVTPAATDTDRHRSTERPYQVVLWVGAADPARPAARTADLNPAADATDVASGVLARLEASGLTPADMRSKVLFVATEGADARTAVAAYAAACAFANRRLDAAVGGQMFDGGLLDSKARSMADIPRPSETIELVQVGKPHPTLPSVNLDSMPGPAALALVRHSRRLRLAVGDAVLAALAQFILVSALRARGSSDRFPVLVNGDEPVELPVVDEDTPAPAIGVDLDALRQAASEMRRTRRVEDRASLAPRVALTSRQKDRLAAAATPIEATMLALGSITNDGELWRCPRPERHTNGDAVPSMKVSNERARCFRCDRERVDSLRLVMDVKACTADEAAAWILVSVDPNASFPRPVAADPDAA